MWQVANFINYLFTSAVKYLFLTGINFLAAKNQLLPSFLLFSSHYCRVTTACCFTYYSKQCNLFLETADYIYYYMLTRECRYASNTYITYARQSCFLLDEQIVVIITVQKKYMFTDFL